MGKRTEFEAGEFCWIDLMTTDRADAERFYSELFEWTPARMEEENGHPYTCFQKADDEGVEQNLVGLGDLSPEMAAAGVPPVWTSYIKVDDVDATCSLTIELGGQVILPAMDVPGEGRMAGIMDPTGAAVFLWQPIAHVGAGLVNEPNLWVWNELITPDPDTAMSFFRDLLGWRFEPFGDEGNYWMLHAREGIAGGGIMLRGDEMSDIPPHWTVYFNTPDVDAKVEALKSLGGSVHVGPFDMAAGRLAICQDPQGAWFNMLAMNVPADP